MSQTKSQEKTSANIILWIALVIVIVVALAIRFAFPDTFNYLAEMATGIETNLANYDPLTWIGTIVVIIIAFAVIGYIAKSRK